MIIIREIDSLRDGGSIVMKLWMTSNNLDKYDLKFESNGYVQVMVDYRTGTETPGSWYNGLKYANAKKILSQEFKDAVIHELSKKIEREQFKLNKLINEREPIQQKV